MKRINLSIVIPVYNEESHLRACLDSIAMQTVSPAEVIVVDNNSTDRSVRIARSYPFVTVLSEKRQGQIFAQATGFAVASSAVLGRIDADTILPADWVARVSETFEQQPDVLAVTGMGSPYDVPMQKGGEMVFWFYHHFLSRLVVGHEMIWGANCALRASTWQAIKGKMSCQRNIWEDYEMAFLIGKIGRIAYVPDIVVGASFRAAHKPLLQQIEYQFRLVRTFQRHTSVWKTILIGVLRSTALLLFPLLMLDAFLLVIKSMRFETSDALGDS